MEHPGWEPLIQRVSLIDSSFFPGGEILKQEIHYSRIYFSYWNPLISPVKLDTPLQNSDFHFKKFFWNNQIHLKTKGDNCLLNSLIQLCWSLIKLKLLLQLLSLKNLIFECRASICMHIQLLPKNCNKFAPYDIYEKKFLYLQFKIFWICSSHFIKYLLNSYFLKGHSNDFGEKKSTFFHNSFLAIYYNDLWSNLSFIILI